MKKALDWKKPFSHFYDYSRVFGAHESFLEYLEGQKKILVDKMRLSLFPNKYYYNFSQIKKWAYSLNLKRTSTELLRQIEWMGMTLSLIEKINHSQTHH